ncbi:Uma2 family endonuclease [Streptomyces oceani]|nr:Uma2 family endonuclease [Streptomyces oceani]
MDQPVPESVEEAFASLSDAAPQGWRVELIEGEIHVTPPANGDHEEIVSELSGQVRDHRKDLGRYTGLGLLLPGGVAHSRVIPDLVVAPKGSFSDRWEYHDPTPVLLVGEVTSRSTGDIDRERKLTGYATAGIPVYLLVDRERDVVKIHSRPSGGRYERTELVSLAQPVTLPEPLGFDLDTSEF